MYVTEQKNKEQTMCFRESQKPKFRKMRSKEPLQHGEIKTFADIVTVTFFLGRKITLNHRQRINNYITAINYLFY